MDESLQSSQITGTPVSVLKLDYDTAPRPLWPRVWAGSALLVVGGCFLIGVMILVGNFGYSPMPSRLTSDQTGLQFVLYGLAFLSLAGGVVVIVISLRSLTRVIKER